VKQRIQVPPLSPPERLDKFLIQRFPQSSRQYWRDHLETTVRVNGKMVAKGLMLSGGEAIELSQLPEVDAALIPNPKIPLQLLEQDEYFLAINKTAGLPCHPLKPNETETLANAVVAIFPEQAHLEPHREAGLVHRLDNGTSGVVLFARSQDAVEELQRCSRGGKMEKTYLAIVIGVLEGHGKADLPIGHHPKNPKKMSVATTEEIAKRLDARVALTEWEALRSGKNATLLRVKIRVGARHQIRVHLAQLGHPILGDTLYGAEPGYPRHFLHAEELAFTHPWSGKKVRLQAEAPEDFQQIQTELFEAKEF